MEEEEEEEEEEEGGNIKIPTLGGGGRGQTYVHLNFMIPACDMTV